MMGVLTTDLSSQPQILRLVLRPSQVKLQGIFRRLLLHADITHRVVILLVFTVDRIGFLIVTQQRIGFCLEGHPVRFTVYQPCIAQSLGIAPLEFGMIVVWDIRQPAIIVKAVPGCLVLLEGAIELRLTPASLLFYLLGQSYTDIAQSRYLMHVGHIRFLKSQTGTLDHLLIVTPVLIDLGKPDIVHCGTLVGEIAVQVSYALIKALLRLIDQSDTAHHRRIGTARGIESVLLVLCQGILALFFHNGQPPVAVYLTEHIERLVAPCLIE